jgi:carboxymethylenebutenolidase
MCFTPDSRPPIPPIAGGALDSSELTLTSSDGNRFMAFGARAAAPTGAGIVVLPDVRGLHAYYRDLALRFAEAGVDALAIDYFGRTAGAGSRGADFEHMPHVGKTTFAGLTADVRAAADHLRSAEGGEVRSLFSVGFCFGGRLAFVSATLGLDLAGVIGFYGVPLGPGRNDVPAPVDVADRMACPVLGLFGGGVRDRPRAGRRGASDRQLPGRSALILRSDVRGARCGIGRRLAPGPELHRREHSGRRIRQAGLGPALVCSPEARRHLRRPARPPWREDRRGQSASGRIAGRGSRGAR